MLDIIARSVDVALAFQALAARGCPARSVRSRRPGALSEDGQEFQTYTARVQAGRAADAAAPESSFEVDRPSSAGWCGRSSRLLIADIEAATPTTSTSNILSAPASSRRC